MRYGFGFTQSYIIRCILYQLFMDICFTPLIFVRKHVEKCSLKYMRNFRKTMISLINKHENGTLDKSQNNDDDLIDRNFIR